MAYPYPIRCEIKIKIGDEPWRDVPDAELTVIDTGPRFREVFIQATARFGIKRVEKDGEESLAHLQSEFKDALEKVPNVAKVVTHNPVNSQEAEKDGAESGSKG